MNCEDFKQWIDNRDFYDEIWAKDAGKHIKQCDACENLHIMDTRIESRIRDALKKIDPPERLVARIEMNIQSAEKERLFNRFQWKILAPAFAVAALLFIVLNPFNGRFRSFDEIGTLAVQDHLNDLPMTFRTGESKDASRWFKDRLGFQISLPDLESLGFQIKGGRKCRLGSNDVAYLLYEKEGKKSSLFIIDYGDLNFRIEEKGTYNMSEQGYDVKVWKYRHQVYAMVK